MLRNARNVGIILALAAVVDLVPGGGSGAGTVNALLSIAFTTTVVLVAGRFYRERRVDIISLGDRYRTLFYGALAVAVLAMAARGRLTQTTSGSVLFIAMLGAAVYALVVVWRYWRTYS